MNPGTIGQRLRAAREATDRRQKALAALAKVHAKTVSRWENDRQRPEGEEFDRYLRVLGITRTWVQTGQEAAADVAGQYALAEHVLFTAGKIAGLADQITQMAASQIRLATSLHDRTRAENGAELSRSEVAAGERAGLPSAARLPMPTARRRRA